jgi:hypothetical protein
MKVRAPVLELSACVLALLSIAALIAGRAASPLLTEELPAADWVVRAVLGIVIWWFGIAYSLGFGLFFRAPKWQKNTAILCLSMVLIHTAIILFAATMAKLDDVMWMLTADVLDNQVCFVLAFLPPLGFWTEVALYALLGGLWYGFCVLCASRLLWLARSFVCRKAGVRSDGGT